MQSRLGQTLFGAALGIVTAAGLAGAVAVASGQMNVRKAIPLTPASANAQVQGRVYRITRGKATGATAYALTSNIPKAFKNAKGVGQSIAQVTGWAHADFFGAGSAYSYGQMGGHPVRLVRLHPISAKGFADALGEGYVFQLMYPAPARAFATGFGTTYHLAYGHALGECDANGQIAWRAGAYGEAVATAQLDGWVTYTASMYGGVANGEAQLHWEPAVTIGGVRYLDAFGNANAFAQSELTNWAYYPSVQAHAYAHAELRAQYFLGIAGVGQAIATLEGTMIGAGTSAGVVQSDSIALATGRLRGYPRGYGNAISSATGSGDAVIKKTGAQGTGVGRVTATQVIDAQVINTKASPNDGYGVAMGKATMNRIRFIAGRAGENYATGVGISVKTQFGYGVAQGRALLTARQYRTRIVGLTPASANAVLSAQIQVDVLPPPANASAEALGQMERIHIASGEAFAAATAEGANQVNDAVKAPATRTVLVTQESRTTVVLAESRTVIV